VRDTGNRHLQSQRSSRSSSKPYQAGRTGAPTGNSAARDWGLAISRREAIASARRGDQAWSARRGRKHFTLYLPNRLHAGRRARPNARRRCERIAGVDFPEQRERHPTAARCAEIRNWSGWRDRRAPCHRGRGRRDTRRRASFRPSVQLITEWAMTAIPSEPGDDTLLMIEKISRIRAECCSKPSAPEYRLSRDRNHRGAVVAPEPHRPIQAFGHHARCSSCPTSTGLSES